MNPKERLAEIRKRLTEAFEPETLGVEDESHLHEGHEGARDGRGHFRVLIISNAFDGKSLSSSTSRRERHARPRRRALPAMAV